tara:strand:+ start:1321 stop:1524 length:204 start_codon:yes stop_codon:yes gene_type:complete
MYILKDEKNIHGVFSNESYATLASRFVQAEHSPGAYPELKIVQVTADKIRGVDVRTLLNFYEGARNG